MGKIVAVVTASDTDLLAIKQADVKISGYSGYDVIKQESDFILTNNTFKHVVTAV
jgi:magnesium-transporting ATPase (P-type)